MTIVFKDDIYYTLEEMYGITAKGEDKRSLADEYARTACGRAKLEAKKSQQVTKQPVRFCV